MAAGRCPMCEKPTEAAYRPFCSRRCADVDLHRWLTGGYAIPAEEGADDVDDDERA
ncbi:MAG: DNA gyrase inhibitor YacG [Hyphomonadaceae bacterium]|nr:DNA gyrase inhibitor YacG [Hyphomonadaceae bacterium]